jgi:hypothetical protein
MNGLYQGRFKQMKFLDYTPLEGGRLEESGGF